MRPLRSILLLSAALSAAAGSSAARAAGQTPSAGRDESWREFESKGGGFKVLLPAKPKHEEKDGEMFSNRWRVETRGEQGAAPVRLAVMYAEVAPTNTRPATAHNMLRSVRDAVVAEFKKQPASDAAVTFDGKPGRLIEFALEGGARARLLLVAHGQRVYRLEAVTPGDTEAERAAVAKFINSFALRPAPAGTGGEVDKLLAEGWLEQGSGGAAVGSGDENLDRNVARKPAPDYTPLAKSSRASGTVRVKVAVDEAGRVVAAQAISGHPLLRDTSVEAARKARFNPKLVDGKPVRIVGFITYNYVIY